MSDEIDGGHTRGGYKPVRDGDVIGSVPIPACAGCGAAKWETDGKITACTGCGECYEEFETRERVLTPDRGYIRVQRFGRKRIATGDEEVLFSIDSGPDDQRPEHDPSIGVYRPICVAQHLTEDESSVYTYLKYCGHCRRRWGSMGDSNKWLCCPFCAATIGHYTFSDGLERFHPDRASGWGDPGHSPPDVWP